MDELLEFFIYIDEDLVKGLYGTLISGYIDVRTVKFIQDRTLAGKVQEGASEGFWGENRETKEERDGYKFKNCIDVDNSKWDKNWNNCFDASQYNRIENSITQIYGTLTFHNNLYQNLQSNSLLNQITALTSNINNLKCGDYVDLKGTILTDSYIGYLDKVINLIDSYTTTKLNSLLDSERNSLMDYDVIYKLLSHFKETLTANDTQDMIIQTDDGQKAIVTVKNNCFLNGTCNSFDKVHCSCNIFGKVLNLCVNQSNGLSLFRKTCCEDYYEQLLDDIEPYMDILRDNGIRVPCKPDYRVSNNTIVIIPISIYH